MLYIFPVMLSLQKAVTKFLWREDLNKSSSSNIFINKTTEFIEDIDIEDIDNNILAPNGQ